ncbi:MAG: transcription-repair coupling factor [Actinobacteria bacterium]|nr:transcription-repair coupling factor [Micrococcales bacterium]MCB9429047.1 transcription-repair coupling factor [Actinomycetota bacterium]MCO5298609.1 transcription-repair coupling factor [Candidatus Nanopelagicales bacterium]
MTLAGVTTRVGSLPDISEWLSRLPEGGSDLAVTPGAEPFVLAAALQQGTTGSLIAITATGRQAEELSNAIADLGFGTAVFPSWETLPHERLSPTADTVGRRMAVISDVAAGTLPQVLVMPVRALMQPFAAELADERPIVVAAGDDPGFDDLVAALARAGYERVTMVERRGQFAVRGGIIDVFAPTQEHPTRIEFFGDEVEELRAFAVSDQRTLEVRKEPLRIPICRELMLTDEVRVRAKSLVDRYPHIADVLGDIASGTPVEGMESLAPVLADRMITLLDLLPAGTPVVNVGPERIEARAVDLARTSEEFLQAGWHNAAVGNAVPLDLSQAAYRSTEQLRAQAHERQLPVSGLGTLGAVAAGLKPAPAYRGDVGALATDCRAAVAAGIPVVIAMGAAGPAQRLAEQLAAQDVAVRLLTDSALDPIVHIVKARLTNGFSTEQVVLVTERDITGTSSTAVTKLPAKRRKALDPLTLKPGDFVVHSQHGVGRYLEMTQRTVAGSVREYLVLEYAASKRGQPADRLYVPTDQLDQVTRYVGGEAPSVHRLGGADWQKAKSKAKKAMREIAAQLVKLYAARQATRGHEFGPDTPWQRELEDAFPYQETPDQLVTIDEVKADMRKPVPMDRLICGDVGFGKTEIAVRAAFKAVQEGKQVAVLVPTTLLVKQHFNTFSERFASFPVRVEALSRFQTDAEAERILQGLADGKVDVVIATHRLLSTKTRIPELGLLIVDEEQRFGVEHKEHVKALRTSVDVLSMSATPIPRTLEMAVTGIREISTIATPPEDRLPVLTFVGPYDHKQIAAAIHRELMREGQVFFIHNRVESIARATAKLAELVPEARIAYAHGQMPEAVLEQTVVDFWEGRIDVLVCTTIVESGMDIPNANTLIVERADAFGLSQLHQLRGRVGRGRERAYAYFLYPPEKPLTQTAHDRLETIAAHTDLGSGMAVAMKDLEIRGAGNLLGGEQSGHIANIGFDLYVRMVGEALAAVRGEHEEEIPEVRIELPLNAHLPHDYVPDERLRLMAYTTLAQATSESQVTEFVEEMIDRYGPLPEPVTVLVEVARLRLLARAAGITDIVMAGTRVRMAPVHLLESRTLRLSRLYPGSIYKAASGTVLVPRPTDGGFGAKPLADHALIQWARSLIESVLDTSRE